MSHNVTSQEEKQKKLIVCLDPGIDDAQAVLMALADPNVKILALCLNHGNTTIENVTNNILRFLKALERKDVSPNRYVFIFDLLTDWLIDFNGQSSRLRLFYASRSVNYVHCGLISINFALLFFWDNFTYSYDIRYSY